MVDYWPYLSKQKRKVNELEALVGSSGAELQSIDRNNASPSILTGALASVGRYSHACTPAYRY